MSTENVTFENFLSMVSPDNLGFVNELHEYLLEKECKVKIQVSKSGYVLSYNHGKTKKVIANYVFRKKGLLMRIYGDNINQYDSILKELPEEMVKEIEKASICKRLHDPTKCNSRCPMGYIFELEGTEHKKCRYGSFMFLLNEESKPVISDFVKKELAARDA